MLRVLALHRQWSSSGLGLHVVGMAYSTLLLHSVVYCSLGKLLLMPDVPTTVSAVNNCHLNHAFHLGMAQPNHTALYHVMLALFLWGKGVMGEGGHGISVCHGLIASRC